MSTFLNRFVDCLPLTDTHRDELRKKRGFHDLTINNLQFKSCGQHVKDIIAHQQWDEADLRKHQIVMEDGQINRQLLSPNVLIPYIDATGSVTRIRPHRLGFKGEGIEPYCEKIFDRTKTTLIITEGEFKAAAAYQYGYNAVSAHSISSFSKNNFDDLVSFISGAKTKNIYILFDSEIKDDPKLPNFKPDWKVRYNTELYTYIMARNFEEKGYTAKCATFPAEWRVNGKIDFDGCLATGKTKDQIDAVLRSAKVPAKYFEDLKLDSEVKKYLQRRAERFYYNSSIKRMNNKYLDEKTDKDGNVYYEDCSNFVININATFYSMDDEVQREVVIINEFGERSKPRILKPEQMNSVQGFAKFGYAQGNYIFKGNEAQLKKIWEWEFSCDEGRHIYDIDHIGRLDHKNFRKHDIWIFENVMIKDGEVVEPDDEGIYWIDGDGLRVRPLSDSESMSESNTPVVNLQPIDMAEVKHHLTQIMGQQAKLFLGWAVFCFLSKYLKFDITPFPFLYGEKQSGKSAACGAIMALFGMPDFNVDFTDITNVAITRLMSYYSGLPIWMDEFENSQRSVSKEPHLKAVYNRIPVIKGVRQSFGVTSYSIRSHLMLSGETIPVTDGLKSRCALLYMKFQEGTKMSLKWLDDHKKKMSNFALQVLQKKSSLIGPVEAKYEELYDAVCTKIPGVDIRTAKHYSLFSACYSIFFGPDREYLSWLETQLRSQKQVIDNDVVSQFFEDIPVLEQDRFIDESYYGYEFDGKRKMIHLWIKGIFDQWSEKYGRRKEIPNYTVMLQNIKKREYYLDSKKKRLGNHPRPVIVIDYEVAPQSLIDLVDKQHGSSESSNVTPIYPARYAGLD